MFHLAVLKEFTIWCCKYYVVILQRFFPAPCLTASHDFIIQSSRDSACSSQAWYYGWLVIDGTLAFQRECEWSVILRLYADLNMQHYFYLRVIRVWIPFWRPERQPAQVEVKVTTAFFIFKWWLGVCSIIFFNSSGRMKDWEVLPFV